MDNLSVLDVGKESILRQLYLYAKINDDNNQLQKMNESPASTSYCLFTRLSDHKARLSAGLFDENRFRLRHLKNTRVQL